MLACILDFENELAKLGVPIKTRHNEVAPAQHEIAPIFENSNVGSDHQQLTMQIMQKVARKYGLVCLLHEKPFAGVNGSGKHNNWSMGTDTGTNLLDPGDTPADNINFLFFCAAVIQAVNKHQGLLRASVAGIGQDHRLGANEAPPAIISIFLGAELTKVFEAISSGSATRTPRARSSSSAPRSCPRCRCTAATATGPRRSPSPATSSSSAPSGRASRWPSRTRSSTPSSPRRSTTSPTSSRPRAPTICRPPSPRWSRTPTTPTSRSSSTATTTTRPGTRRPRERGLKNLRTTPDALPEVLADPTVAMMSKYKVLNKRELESRYEVWLEQYIIRANIEAETADTMARTMILPAALRYLALGDEAGIGAVTEETTPLVDELVAAIKELDEANQYPDGLEGMDLAIYARDKQVAGMARVREAADKLEKIVPDDLWPLPKYAEMLFIR